MTIIATVISETEAKASDLKHYYTGKPCKNGHLSPRGVENRTCLQCQKEKAVAKRAYDIEHRPEYAERKRQLVRERWGDTLRKARIRRASNRADWGKLSLPRIRHRAKKMGIEFLITAEDIQLPDICPVLGIPLEISLTGDNVGMCPNSPSVDRMDNTKGYIPGNVMVISARANLLKKDANLNEMRALLAYMERIAP